MGLPPGAVGRPTYDIYEHMDRVMLNGGAARPLYTDLEQAMAQCIYLPWMGYPPRPFSIAPRRGSRHV